MESSEHIRSATAQTGLLLRARETVLGQSVGSQTAIQLRDKPKCQRCWNGKRVEVRKPMMMRQVDSTQRELTTRGVEISGLTKIPVRRQQTQRDSREAMWQTELQEKDRQITALEKEQEKERQITALGEEQERLMRLLWRERQHRRNERRAVETQRWRERTGWRKRMEDCERHILSAVLSLTEMKRISNWSADPQDQCFSTRGGHWELQRHYTGQAKQRHPTWRQSERGCNLRGQNYSRDMKEFALSLTPAMLKDMIKAREQDALRVRLMEKRRLNESEVKEAEQRKDVANGVENGRKRWRLLGFCWFGITREIQDEGDVYCAIETVRQK